MKKFISMCTACFILCSLLIVQSSAIDITTEQKDILKDAEQYAYLDPDTASPELQEKILDARNAIIFSQGWVADGHTGYIQDVRTGEILRELPTFSELFPDWDMPTADTVPKSDSEYTEPSVRPFQAEVTPLVYYTKIALRTSTYSTPGWETIALDGADRVADLR